jgi:hypothetical protein
MGGKKKKAGGGGKEGDEEDISVDNFMKAYRKKCTELGCEASKIIKEKYDLYQEEGEPIDKVSLSLSQSRSVGGMSNCYKKDTP